MYEIRFSKDVVKFIKKSQTSYQKNYINAFEIISLNPLDSSLDIKPLVNKKNHFRLRIGKYRFLYEIISDQHLFIFIKLIHVVRCTRAK
jgi:mRNA interferase RelE/StbE